MSGVGLTLLVALGALVGAPLRFVLVRLDAEFPTGMLLVNVLGSGLFGLFAALSPGEAWWALLGTGFCGGFTSFSTFALQSVQRGLRGGAAYVVATTAFSVGACALGWAAGIALV